jgi:hypothetical protein
MLKISNLRPTLDKEKDPGKHTHHASPPPTQPGNTLPCPSEITLSFEAF